MPDVSLIRNVHGVTKVTALDNYIRDKLPFFIGLVWAEGNPVVEFVFNRELTAEELALFESLVTSYTDPEFWFTLAKRESMPLSTKPTSSTTPYELTTFIMTPGDVDSARLECFKTILEFRTSRVEDFVDFDESSVNTGHIRLYCATRHVTVAEETIDITPVLAQWKAMAVSGQTGHADTLKTLQIYGLYEKTPASYDCVWKFLAWVSNPAVEMSMNGLEKIYYYINY